MLGKELQNPDVNALHEQHDIAADNDRSREREGEGRHAAMAERLEELNDGMAALETAIRSAVAEADHARHRAEADLARASRYGIEEFARDLLPFKDALEAALAVDTSDANALRTGLELSLKLLQTALKKNGLGEISPRLSP